MNLTYSKTSLTHQMVLCPIQITHARIDFKRRAVSSNVLYDFFISCIDFSSLFRFNIDLQTLTISGKQTDTPNRPVLATGNAISTLPVIHVELELAPLDKKSDYRLLLRIEPLKIVYDAVGDHVQAR